MTLSKPKKIELYVRLKTTLFTTAGAGFKIERRTKINYFITIGWTTVDIRFSQRTVYGDNFQPILVI